MIFCLNGKHRSAQVAATCLVIFFNTIQAAFNEAIVSKSCHRGPLESPDHSSPRLGPAFPERPRGMGGMGMTPSDWFVFVSISRGCHAHCFPRRSPTRSLFCVGSCFSVVRPPAATPQKCDCNECVTPLEIDTTQVILFRQCCDFSPIRGHVPPNRAHERYRDTMEQVFKELCDVLGLPLVGFWSAEDGTAPRCCTTA